MSSQKENSLRPFLIFFAVFGVIAFVFAGFLKKKKLEIDTRKAVIAAEAAFKAQKQKEAEMGYPAEESQISSGKYYYADASFYYKWPDHTDYYVVLQEMTPNGENWRQVLGQKRLYRVSFNVGDRTIYLAERPNGKLTLSKMRNQLPPEPQVNPPTPVTPRTIERRT